MISFLTKPYVSASISIFSLIVTCIAFYFTYITFVSPIYRFRKLLAYPNDWLRVNGAPDLLDIWRHQRFSSYSIEVDFREHVAEGFKEAWMDQANFPDMDHNNSYWVRVFSSGSLLDSELFVSCDGGRYLLPVPKIQYKPREKPRYHLTEQQIYLANIVGKVYIEKDQRDFWSKIQMVEWPQQQRSFKSKLMMWLRYTSQ